MLFHRTCQQWQQQLLSNRGHWQYCPQANNEMSQKGLCSLRVTEINKEGKQQLKSFAAVYFSNLQCNLPMQIFQNH